MTPTSQPSSPATVLLVEDHVDSRLMYAEFLRMHFTVLEAGDGRSALDQIRHTRPDVIVTDLALPGMDGFELVTRIRADPGLAGVTVIALSGYTTAEHEARAREAGCDLILQKPCLPDDLARAVVEASRSRKDIR
jgi:CheY-like chemotaxis protein